MTKAQDLRNRIIRRELMYLRYPDPDHEYTMRWINGRTYYATASGWRPYREPVWSTSSKPGP